MPQYRCYFLSSDDSIVWFEQADHPSDDDAIRWAEALLRDRPHHAGVELWHRSRVVHRHRHPG